MSGKLNKGIAAYTRGQSLASEQSTDRDPRALLTVSVIYLATLLSMPLENLSGLIWFGIYPILACGMLDIKFSKVFLRSLWILPLVLMIGIFNPIVDHAPGATIGGLELSHGWLTFLSLTLRGIFAVQALIILTLSCGFIGMCRAMRRIHVPSFLTTQLEMVYRYCGTLLDEVQQMRRARISRGYGRKTMTLRLWGPMIGQLFIRSIDRAQRVHQAMICRGFTGSMPDYSSSRSRWTKTDTIYLVAWIAVFILLRFLNPELLFNR